MEDKICINCRGKVKNEDTACYSREANGFLCSLNCLTDYGHEYLSCVPFKEGILLETKK